MMFSFVRLLRRLLGAPPLSMDRRSLGQGATPVYRRGQVSAVRRVLRFALCLRGRRLAVGAGLDLGLIGIQPKIIAPVIFCFVHGVIGAAE
jgi:hypothetical protein